MFAKRVRNLKPSGIRKIFQLVAEMENPINFSIGQAHFDVPEAAKKAAIDAIERGQNRYTVTQGIPELNERVQTLIRDRSGKVPESSLVTTGVSGGLMLSYLALLDPGDEILIPDPYFVIYRVMAEVLDIKPVFYDVYPDFKLDEAKLESLVTEKTKVLLLNSPANPTGAVLSAEELQAAARVAERHGLTIISDEIYDAFVYDAPYRSIVEFSDRALLLGGFSKTYGMPGWRLGYALGPHELIDVMETLQQFSFVCAPTPFQWGGLAALDVDMSAAIAEYRNKRRVVVEGLGPHYELVIPGGSFYAFPKLPPGFDSTSLVKAALEKRLLIVPGTAFSNRDTHFRISFAVDDEVLQEGISILRDFAESGRIARAAE